MNIYEAIAMRFAKLKFIYLVMELRRAVKKYFDLKYLKPDPYKVNSNTFDNRYLDMLSLIEKLKLNKGLDVGCGEGTFSRLLLNVCEEVNGVDISKSAIQRASKVYKKYSKLNFCVKDIATEKIESKYDIIICAEILYYLNRRQIIKVLRNLHKALFSSGYLLVGNIKKIGSGQGFFRSHISASEINKICLDTKYFKKIAYLDRGGDVILLLQKIEGKLLIGN